MLDDFCSTFQNCLLCWAVKKAPVRSAAHLFYIGAGGKIPLGERAKTTRDYKKDRESLLEKGDFP